MKICLLSVHFSAHTSYFNKWGTNETWLAMKMIETGRWVHWEFIILFYPPLDECKIIKNKIPMRTNDTSSQKCWIRIQFFQKTGNNSTNYKLYKPELQMYVVIISKPNCLKVPLRNKSPSYFLPQSENLCDFSNRTTFYTDSEATTPRK